MRQLLEDDDAHTFAATSAGWRDERVRDQTLVMASSPSIHEHLDGNVAWTQSRASNSAVEGTNNRAKPVSHRTFGHRTTDAHITEIGYARGDLPLQQSHLRETNSILVDERGVQSVR